MERSASSYRVTAMGFALAFHPSSRIPPIPKLPVVPICRTPPRLLRRANHNDPLGHPAPMKRDVSADRHEPGGGDAVDADGTSDERG